MSTVTKERHDWPNEASVLRPIRDVAEFLAISRSQVYQLMEAGSLPYVKLGKSRRVRWSDVMDLVEKNVVSRA